MGVVSREIRIGPGPVLAARIAGRAAIAATRSAAVNAVPGIDRHVGADGRTAARLRPCAVGRQRLAEIAANIACAPDRSGDPLVVRDIQVV